MGSAQAPCEGDPTVKLCECGCGRPAPIAKQTVRKLGHVKGEPVRFVNGHMNRGRKMPPRPFRPQSQETRDKISAALRGRIFGEKHWSYKGGKASYSAVHHWMNRHHPRLGVCEECGATGRTQWANLDHSYRRVREDWRELCVTCHRRYDAGTLTFKEVRH